jgi:hypothetical protein
METAPLCGSDRYQDMLIELTRIPGFRQRWMSIPCQDEPFIVGMPEEVSRPGLGHFRVFVSTLRLPAPYHLLEYVPVDDQAWTTLTELWRHGPSEFRLGPTLAA